MNLKEIIDEAYVEIEYDSSIATEILIELIAPNYYNTN